eukprot:gene1450-32825_t
MTTTLSASKRAKPLNVSLLFAMANHDHYLSASKRASPETCPSCLPMANHDHYPEILFVLRDGIGGSQTEELFDNEIAGIHAALQELSDMDMESGLVSGRGADTKDVRLIFISSQKRHNTRLFPDSGPNKRSHGGNQPETSNVSKSGNVKAGTIVEDVCSDGLEFILHSHSGLQGTSRGCLYRIISDEIGLTLDEIQRFCYWLCFLYCRCNK